MGYIGKELEEVAIINTPVKSLSKFMDRWLTKAVVCIPGNPLGFMISGLLPSPAFEEDRTIIALSLMKRN